MVQTVPVLVRPRSYFSVNRCTFRSQQRFLARFILVITYYFGVMMNYILALFRSFIESKKRFRRGLQCSNCCKRAARAVNAENKNNAGKFYFL